MNIDFVVFILALVLLIVLNYAFYFNVSKKIKFNSEKYFTLKMILFRKEKYWENILNLPGNIPESEQKELDTYRETAYKSYLKNWLKINAVPFVLILWKMLVIFYRSKSLYLITLIIIMFAVTIYIANYFMFNAFAKISIDKYMKETNKNPDLFLFELLKILEKVISTRGM